MVEGRGAHGTSKAAHLRQCATAWCSYILRLFRMAADNQTLGVWALGFQVSRAFHSHILYNGTAPRAHNDAWQRRWARIHVRAGYEHCANGPSCRNALA